MRALISRNKPWSAGILAAGISLLLACGGGGGGPQQTFGVVALNNVGTIGVLDGSPPPRDFFGHQIGDDPLRGDHEEEGRIPAGRWCAGRP